MATKSGITQSFANDLATGGEAGFSSGATNKLLLKNAFETTIATATDVDVTVSANVITFTSVAGASITSTDTATGFELTDSSDVVKITMYNLTKTITPANQSTGADTFTLTAHGLEDGQAINIGGGIPTTSPAVSDGDAVFVTAQTANTFQIERQPGAGAVDITAAAGTNTTFTLPTAVGAAASGAVLEITGGTSLTSGNVALVSSCTYTIPLDNVVSGQ